MRFMIFGFGAVAKSLLEILRKENIVEIPDLQIVERNEKNIGGVNGDGSR